MVAQKMGSSIDIMVGAISLIIWWDFKLGLNKAGVQPSWLIQGDPNQNSPFLRAITQKLSISDLKLVKPKCVWEDVVFFNFQTFV